MCGICGYYLFERTPELNTQTLETMRDRMIHRGPDDAGIYETEDQKVALAHRRLSIIDLSHLGKQPMANDSGEIFITYNGEVYNFQELRSELKSHGYSFRSATDTEVVLKLYEHLGIDFLERLNGIFALTIWDNRHKKLIVARDRFGTKPLYYIRNQNYFAFASEMKALLAIPGFETNLNHQGLFDFLKFVYVPGEQTGMQTIKKLKPGHALVIQENEIKEHKFGQAWKDSSHHAPNLSEDETAEQIKEKLEAAVKRQLIADVPVGLFLSGGLDSSSILGLMKTNNQDNTNSYSVGFSQEDLAYESDSSDLNYARQLAKQYETIHNEYILKPDLADLLPTIIYHLDDLFSDPATIPTYLISKEASGSSTVLLSGQGADEIYGGYPWHLAEHISSKYAQIPGFVRQNIASITNRFVKGADVGRLAQTKRRIRKFANNGAQDYADRVMGFVSHLNPQDIEELLVEDLAAEYRQVGHSHFHRGILEEHADHNNLTRQMLMDMGTLLSEMNLMYTDKLSMAHSIETRVPFLDNDLVHHAFSIPTNLKVSGLTRKKVLKKAMEPVLPHEIIYRKKAGFGSPIRSWLKGSLKPMMEDLLSEETLIRRGYFKPATVRRFIDEFDNGTVDRSHGLFSLLCFEIWCQTFLDAR